MRLSPEDLIGAFTEHPLASLTLACEVEAMERVLADFRRAGLGAPLG